MEEFIERIDEKPGHGRSGTVNNWETGKNAPNAKRLKKIAQLGNVSVNYLLYGYDLNKSQLIKNLYDLVRVEYFRPNANGIRYGMKTYDLVSTLDEYFDSKGVATLYDKFYDSKNDKAPDIDTPGVTQYLMDNLSILRSDEFIQELIRQGGVNTTLQGNNIELDNEVDDAVAIALLCTKLQKMINASKSPSLPQLENDFYDIVAKYRHSIATLLERNDSISKKEAAKKLTSFVTELMAFRGKL